MTWEKIESIHKVPSGDGRFHPLTPTQIEAFRERKGPGWCPCMMYRYPWECDCSPEETM